MRESSRATGDRPTFVGIGGMKCASTWLAECLRAHPEVFVTSPKEVHFFDTPENLARGEEWYWRHFAGSGAYRAAGEVGATYLGGAQSVSRMRQVLGTVRVLVSLRDPVERFLSEYKHRIRGGELPLREFRRLNRETLAEAIRRQPTLEDWSLYARRLEEFFDAFSRERTLVVLKDDIDSDPVAALRRLYAFIGVAADFRPPVATKPVSRGIVPRSMVAETVRRRLYGAVRERAPGVIDWVRRTRLGEVYRRLNAASASAGIAVDPAVRALLRERFADDIAATERLIGRRLSARADRRGAA